MRARANMDKNNMISVLVGGWGSAADGRNASLLVMVATALVCCIVARARNMRKRRRLPPGPGMALPLIGHMHLLGRFVYKSLHELSQRYGPILYLRLGRHPTVVISSPSLAKQFLHDLDEAFAFRPALESGEHMFYNYAIGLMQPDDPQWKDLRRLFTREILSPKALLCSKQLRDEEMSLLLQELRSRADAGECVEVRSLATGWILDVMNRLLVSRSVSKDVDGLMSQLPHVLKELADLFAQPLLGDMVPCLRWFDPQGIRNRMKLHTKRMDALLQRLLDNRLQQQQCRPSSCAVESDALTALLAYFGITSASTNSTNTAFECRPVKGIILDILIASSDTTSTTVEWAMLELLRASSKSKLARLQTELRAVVEPGQQVEETHTNSLPYLQAVAKETLRLHPPAPLLLPHLAREPTEIGGYFLPRNTRLFFNVWAMGRDESLWEAADEFRPERFLQQLDGGKSTSDVNNNNGLLGGQSSLMPFGRGRRGCPGQNLGITMLSLLLANLVHNFDWEPSRSSFLDEEAGDRFLGRLAHPFAATPSIRA